MLKALIWYAKQRLNRIKSNYDEEQAEKSYLDTQRRLKQEAVGEAEEEMHRLQIQRARLTLHPMFFMPHSETGQEAARTLDQKIAKENSLSHAWGDCDEKICQFCRAYKEQEREKVYRTKGERKKAQSKRKESQQPLSPEKETRRAGKSLR